MIAHLQLSLKGSSMPTDEQWLIIQELFPNHKSKEKPQYWWGETLTSDIESVLLKTADKGFNVMVEAFSTTALVKLKDKYDSAIEDVENYTRGNIVQVHIPDYALLTYNEVCHLDDCCTDALQKELDAGWRIIAVCPPNAQRRPDYILGRYCRQEKR